MSKTKQKHKHKWRAYGRMDATVVCDDCNIAEDVDTIIIQTLKELKEEIDGQQPDPDYYAQAIDNKIKEIKDD